MEMSEAVHLDDFADRQPRALVVDDDAIGRMMLGALLEDLGYVVEEAEDGRAGVERFNASPPDIVFMDMMMPVMGGVEAARHIKQGCERAFVPVIFVTGNGDEQDLVRCIDAGGDDFLVKPCSQAVLAAKIRAMERIRALHLHSDQLRQRMEEEQQLARDIFESAVMKANVRTPALTAHLAPATTFNGDLLLCAYTPEGALHVLLGDFTGHGLAATIGALPVAETFRAMTAKGFAPAEILFEVNRKLRTLLPTGRFLAAAFLRVERSLDSVSVTNCGMPEAWLFGASGLKGRFASTGLPLAVIADADYEAAQASLTVAPGDRILLVSDGALELSDAAGRVFGAVALRAAVEAGLAHERPLDAAIAAIGAFRSGAPAVDDESLVEVHLVPALFPDAPVGAQFTETPGKAIRAAQRPAPHRAADCSTR
jgi:CheY-like chemotaxis protein